MTDLDALVAAWLPDQRWYGGRGQAAPTVKVEVVAEIPGDQVRIALAVAQVNHDDAEPAYYSVPLALRKAADPDVAHAILDAAEPQITDALHDAEACELLLRFLASGSVIGPVTAIAPEPITPQRGRPVGAEQSNTSVVYGDAYILKCFRRLVAGTNPDLEVSRALVARGGSHVPPPLAWLETSAPFAATVALLQPFYRSASEGWAMATTSVRDVLADLSVPVAEAGGDFAGEATRLGLATAELHADLAVALPTERRPPGAFAAVAADLRDRLDQAVAEVPELAEHASAISAVYDALAEVDEALDVQRVHGDFHLGQVLRVDSGWIVLDFEGEPARPLTDRTALMSPLRDVAGMLRSFDYAARHLLADWSHERLPDPGALEYRAVEWAERNRAAYLDGYSASAGRDPAATALLMRAFELDKAVYEARYEAAHRPSWLPIPLAGIARLAG